MEYFGDVEETDHIPIFVAHGLKVNEGEFA
jgi:hypothetical protein